MTMKKLLLTMAMISLCASAAIKSVNGYNEDAVFYQFTHDEATNTGNYRHYSNIGQYWAGGVGPQIIRLTVPGEMDVWLSNYVRSWYEPIVALDGNKFDMSEAKYGAVQVNGDKTWVGTGDTTEVTYTDGAGHDNSTEAYFLGHFEGGEEVYLYLTLLEAEDYETVTTDQYVEDPEHSTHLVSREDGTHDQAGNVRVNLTVDINDPVFSTAREFVVFGAGYEEDSDIVTTGGPLPCLPFAAILSFGTIAAMKRRKQA